MICRFEEVFGAHYWLFLATLVKSPYKLNSWMMSMKPLVPIDVIQFPKGAFDASETSYQLFKSSLNAVIVSSEDQMEFNTV